MTDHACPNPAKYPAHDLQYVALRLVVPADVRLGIRAEHILRCDTLHCPLRHEDQVEAALDFEGSIRAAFTARGMLGCNHENGEPSGFKGCLPTCRTYPAPPGNGTTGATFIHAAGCQHGLRLEILDSLGPEAMQEGARRAFSACYGGPGPHLDPCRCNVSMEALRDAPRPAIGATTTDPDAFLHRATAKRQSPRQGSSLSGVDLGYGSGWIDPARLAKDQGGPGMDACSRCLRPFQAGQRFDQTLGEGRFHAEPKDCGQDGRRPG